MILVAAVPNGPSATTGLWVGAATPRIVPGGLPLQVIRLQGTDGKVSYRVRGSGWSAGKTVVVSVFSADGTLDVPVAAPPAPVAAAGTFQATWAPDAGWAGRSDLGIRAITTDGTQASIRYLPWAMLSKTAQGGTFQIQGVGWPGVVGLCAEMHRPGAPDTELGRVTTDGTGAFRLTLALPRVPDNPRNSIEICTPDEVYSAQFGF